MPLNEQFKLNRKPACACCFRNEITAECLLVTTKSDHGVLIVGKKIASIQTEAVQKAITVIFAET